ncbi:MAG: ABC transporter substrate-binding protein [gamma proteobacterium symbiont of Taylorina sp.]|nr:ABC transporter substrate-binding protein [gamma proteobacterium symbiont of Taylorina sp.]
MKKIFLLTLLAVFCCKTAIAKEPLRVGYLPILDHLPLVVSHAQDNSSFKHVDVQTKKFKSWKKMVGALKNKVIDAAFILSPLAISLHNSGQDIQTILLAHRDGSAITVRHDSSISSAKDLKGKIIAIPDKKSTHLALLSKYLIDNGLSLADVKTPVIAPPHMEKAMAKGAIDAFIVAEPFGAKAQVNGVGNILVLTSSIINNHVECIVIMNKDYINSNAQGVQEWVDSLIRAGKFIDNDKITNGSKNVAKIVADKKYMGHPEQVTINGLQKPSDRISFSDLNPTAQGFEPIVNISKQANIIKKADLANFINNSFYNNSTEK